MYSAREKVFWFSITSRILTLVLQLICNKVCPDHNADAFRTPEDPLEKTSLLDHVILFLFDGLTRWDAQYYIHIAKYGYTYENTLAFFPLFPMSMRYGAVFIQSFLPLNFSAAIVLSGVVINFFCFVKSSLIFYDLSNVVFNDTKIAYRSAVFYCLSPASIFFSAIYTESMFSYFTFYAMLTAIDDNPYVFLPLSLSTLVRSNGLVNLGFTLYTWLKTFLIVHVPNFLAEYRYYSSAKLLLFDLRHIFAGIFQLVGMMILSLFPIFLLQTYNYSIFCTGENNSTFPIHVIEQAKQNNLLLPQDQNFPWCTAKIPVAYSYIQKKYWNVGFMSYYQWKQLPNFVIAIPILYFMLKCIWEFFQENKSKLFTRSFYKNRVERGEHKKEKYPAEMFVFVMHGLFLTVFSIFFVHIQVSTRLLCSASPLLYWYCALAVSQKIKLSGSSKDVDFEDLENQFSKWKVFFITQRFYTLEEKIILGYFFGYFIAGCFMYSNFLPWT